MHNALHPDELTPIERLEEIATIFSQGFLRLYINKKHIKFNNIGKNSLDFTAGKSVHE